MPYIFHNQSAADRFADDCVRQHNVGRKRAGKPVLEVHPEIVRTTLRRRAAETNSGDKNDLSADMAKVLEALQAKIDNPEPPPPPPEPAAAPKPKRGRPRKAVFR